MFAVVSPSYHHQIPGLYLHSGRKVLSNEKLARGQENKKIPDMPREEKHTRC